MGDRWKLLVALTTLAVVLPGSAQEQLTIDATKQLPRPAWGRGPFPGFDFLITNVGTEPLNLPVSIDCRTESMDIPILWFSSDAIKDQY